ncbi:CYTH domain-containing protein [Kiritimatiella glycovorans]|uniref:CYTH domain-containing protein n=1 Tax=Kiritimatiella glycovorans TaxID=1307763 RepID=A0A0G3EIW8_9BACT|nr:CYTH domain-containing protein [Kiritimatiella glycovorans]AKJ65352.1 hypothetical protein L21SP4_02121 [Kiritimatiella glycovorans]
MEQYERRFLVERLPDLAGTAGERVVQGYFYFDRGVGRVRLAGGDRAYLALKCPGEAGTHHEFEYPLPPDDAREMLERLCETPWIDKTRYRLPHAGRIIELDCFHGAYEGLMIAELETRPGEEAVGSLPAWVGEEITGQHRWSNAGLVRAGQRA